MNDKTLPRVVFTDEENGVRIVETNYCGHDTDWHTEEARQACIGRYWVELSYERNAMKDPCWSTLRDDRAVAREVPHLVRALIRLVDSLHSTER